MILPPPLDASRGREPRAGDALDLGTKAKSTPELNH